LFFILYNWAFHFVGSTGEGFFKRIGAGICVEGLSGYEHTDFNRIPLRSVIASVFLIFQEYFSALNAFEIGIQLADFFVNEFLQIIADTKSS